MAAYVQEYVDYVRAIAGVRLVEQPYALPPLLGSKALKAPLMW
ncbi:hypothetical protein [Xylella fastidiosa]|nr:hypothetical protein [Xylella fastidiosa]